MPLGKTRTVSPHLQHRLVVDPSVHLVEEVRGIDAGTLHQLVPSAGVVVHVGRHVVNLAWKTVHESLDTVIRH